MTTVGLVLQPLVNPLIALVSVNRAAHILITLLPHFSLCDMICVIDRGKPVSV